MNGQSLLKRVYVTQFGGWWSFTPAQWREFVANVVSADGDYRLPDERMIKHRPCVIRSYRMDDMDDNVRTCLYSTSYSHALVKPLDQDLEWWNEQLSA